MRLRRPLGTPREESSREVVTGGVKGGETTAPSGSTTGATGATTAPAGASGGGAVPLHPEVVDGDPLVLRWVIPPGTLAVRGVVTGMPAPLAALVEAGEVASVEVDAQAVAVRLSGGRSWRESGSRVRSALTAALRDPDAWVADAGRIEGRDAALVEAVTAALAGEAGDYIRSHGGDIALVGVHDGCVDVRLGGACGHCPAATATLRFRLEAAVRQTCPDLVALRQIS